MDIDHILFPTDFSDAADNAYRYCLEMANLMDAKITILHVYTLPDIHDLTLPTKLEEVYDEISVEEFENFKDKIPHMDAIAEEVGITRLKVNHSLKEGDVKDVILNQIDLLDIDMIVMGTQGASLIERYFIGNHTSYIMEHADVPVLGVPPNAKLVASIDSIAMCTDYSNSDREVLRVVKSIFKKYQDFITTFHVNSSSSESSHDEWEEFILKENVHFVSVEADSLLKGIQAYDKTYGMDILIMRTHVKNAIQDFFNRGKAKSVVYSKTVPLLAIPEKLLSKLSS